MRAYSLPFLLLLVAFAAPAHAGERWAKLRVGMTRGDAAALVGVPVLRGGANGYEQWFFDYSGEIGFHFGRVIYFSAPQADAPDTAPAGGSGPSWNPDLEEVVVKPAAKPVPGRLMRL